MYIIDFENIDVAYDNIDSYKDRDIDSNYKENIVLKDINLKIEEGSHWAILGANGSGKSTLLKLILSEIHPRATKEFKKEIMGLKRYSIFELKKYLGVITNDLHNYFLQNASYMNGFEVVLSGYYSSIGIFTHQDFTSSQISKVFEVMNFLDIINLKDKKVSAMSTGELRKCLIARALIHTPKAFILDEPTVGLDIKSQINFIKMLKKLSKTTSIILVTHHLEEIFEEIDNVALIYNKTIYKSGKKDEILTSENLSEIFDTKISIKKKNERYFIEEIL